MKKKVLTAVLTGVMVFGMAACGSNGESTSDAGSDSGSDKEASAEAPTGEISVISREDGSGTRGAFIELFGIEEKDDSGEKIDNTTEDAQVTNNTSVMMTSVAGDPQAIGYISLGSLDKSVKALKVDGAEATAENVKNDTYKISRPSSVTPVMEKLKEGYEAVNPDAEIEIQQSDSTTGMESAISGVCDIGMASRELKDSETEAALKGQEIALDGIAVIVNNENAMTDITSDQVKEIYTGEVTDWEDLQ